MTRIFLGLLTGAFFMTGAAFAGQEVTITDEKGNSVRDDRAFIGVVPMSVGTIYAVGRSLSAICTVAGNVSVTFQDASTFVFPVQSGFQTLPFAVTAVNSSGTTATCTYGNLK